MHEAGVGGAAVGGRGTGRKRTRGEVGGGGGSVKRFVPSVN